MLASLLEVVILCMVTSGVRRSSDCHFPHAVRVAYRPAVRRYENLVPLGAASRGVHASRGRSVGVLAGLRGHDLSDALSGLGPGLASPSGLLVFLLWISRASGGWVTGTVPLLTRPLKAPLRPDPSR